MQDIRGEAFAASSSRALYAYAKDLDFSFGHPALEGGDEYTFPKPTESRAAAAPR